GELGVAERLGAPIGELLLLRQDKAQHVEGEVLETVLVGICAGDARGDLGAIDGERHDSQTLVQHGEIEAGEMKNFEDRPVGEKLGEIGRLARARRDLDHIGGAIARRELHHAEPIAVHIESHGLGIDCYRTAAVARQIGQIAAMQTDGHDSGNGTNLVPRRGLEPPRLAALVPETSASTNSATWALRDRYGAHPSLSNGRTLCSIKAIRYSAHEKLARA